MKFNCVLCVLSFVIGVCTICFAITEKDYYTIPPVFHLDDYDKCFATDENGFFCNVQMEISTKENSSSYDIIRNLNGDSRNYNHSHLRHGICVFDFCPKLDFARINSSGTFKDSLSICYNEKYKRSGISAYSLMEPDCEYSDSKYEIDDVDLTFTITVIILKVTITLATIYAAIFKSKVRDSKFASALECFSMHQNWKLLLKKTVAENDTGLLFFYGFKFILMFLIILIDSTMIQLSIPISNTHSVEEFIEGIPQAVFHLLIMVTSIFFILSGWLFSVKFFRRKSSLYSNFFFTSLMKRIFRIAPLLVLIIGFTSTIAVHLSEGPIWNKLIGTEFQNCRANWWTNLLFINNYVNVLEPCLQQTWVLAALMQMHFLTIFIMSVAVLFRKYMAQALISIIVICAILPGLSAYFIKMMIDGNVTSEFLYSMSLNNYDFINMNYSTHNNLIYYYLGIYFGYLFITKKDSELFNTKWRTIAWIAISLGSILTAILTGILMEANHVNNTIALAMYQSISRSCFGLGVSVFLFGIAQGKAGFIRKMFEWTPLYVLGKLSFVAYLIHYTLIKIRVGDARSTLHISTFNLVSTIQNQIYITQIL